MDSIKPSFRAYATVSPEVKRQIDRITEIFISTLGSAVTGIYLHGSLCLGAFVESVSDIDVLALTGRRIEREERLTLARLVMEQEYKPCPIEISAVRESDIMPWQYPTKCQFHYSDYHTESYRKLLSGETGSFFLVDTDFTDVDIACHARLAKQSGICLYGKEASEALPEVRERDFIDSLAGDIDNYDFAACKPRYFNSNILLLCRVLSYLVEGRILSKYEAAIWVSDKLEPRFRYIVNDALEVWYMGKAPTEYDESDLAALRNTLVEEIKKRLVAL